MIPDCINWPASSLQTTVFRFVSFWGDGYIIPIAVVLLLALYFLLVARDKIFALVLVLAPLVGQITKSVLKNTLQVTRPAESGCRLLTDYGDRFSFPSGHTVFYTIIFGLVAYYALERSNGRRGLPVALVAIMIIALIGPSRIYLGAHWIPDIVFGYLVGGFILIMTILAYNHFSKKKGRQ